MKKKQGTVREEYFHCTVEALLISAYDKENGTGKRRVFPLLTLPLDGKKMGTVRKGYLYF